MIYWSNFLFLLQEYSGEIGLISGVITILLFIRGILWGLKTFLLKEKVKIKSFKLFKDENNSSQNYTFLYGKFLYLDNKIYEEAFPWNLLYNGYSFPKFEILFQNNSNNTEVLEDFKIKIKKIDYSIRRYIGIEFKGTEIYKFDELEGQYSNLKINFWNLSVDPIYDLTLTSVEFRGNDNKILYSCKLEDKFNLNTGESKIIDIRVNTNKLNSIIKDLYPKISKTKFKEDEYPIVIPKIIINYKYKTKKNNWLYKKGLKKMTFHEWGQHFFYNIKNGFFCKVGEIGGGGYFAEDKGNFIIDTEKSQNNLNKILKAPLKRIIKTKDIDNFTFSLGVTNPALVTLELIFDFGRSKIKKYVVLDLYYPSNNDYIIEFKNNAKKFKY